LHSVERTPFNPRYWNDDCEYKWYNCSKWARLIIQFGKIDADEVRAVRSGHNLEKRGKRAVQMRFEFDVFDRTLLNDEIRH
jgi:hypothetical protein